MANSSDDRPQSAAENAHQGWQFYGKGDLRAAEECFRIAISLSPALVDAYFGLGLALKAQNRGPEAIEIFQKVVDLLEKDTTIDSTRRAMLRRLTSGQINLLKSGDWGLEKEIWVRSK
jgi:tetratricopeptide (TPR) repeat protein